MSLLFFACSGTRKLAENQQLLIKNKIKIEDKAENLSKSDISNLIKQKPNESFLGIRIRLWFYTMSNLKKENWINRTLRNMGQAPVVYDSIFTQRSLANIERYNKNHGYFFSKVEFLTKTKRTNKRKIKAYYIIKPGEPYKIRNIEAVIRDSSLLFLKDLWKKQSLLQKGHMYDLSVLERERARIERILQDRGYYAFSKEYISYAVDTNVGSKEVDIRWILRGVRLAENDSLGAPQFMSHKTYYIDKVFYRIEEGLEILNDTVSFDTIAFYPGSKKEKRNSVAYSMPYFMYKGKPLIKPRAVYQKSFLVPDEKFSLTNVEKTYENLSDLRILGYTNINFWEASPLHGIYEDSVPLNCRLSIVKSKRYSFSTDAEITTSSGVQGLAANVSVQDRNIFKGGEILSLRVRGAFELQPSLDAQQNKKLSTTFEIKADLGLEFPRFLAPISIDRFSKYFRPKTLFNIGYSYQMKREYKRTIVNASWSYHWKKLPNIHNLAPVEVNVVKMYATDEFLRIIENLSQGNPRLKYQYEDHFILNSRYTYVYNGQSLKKNTDFSYFRLNVEAAGNLLWLIYKAASAPKNTAAQYQMFNLSFSQYLKTDADFKRHLIWGDHTLVLRARVGAGFYYANSKSMPYEKAFFGGGSSNMRAFPLYHLGPGSYIDTSSTRIEQLGDIVLGLNAEYRFPIVAGLKGTLFMDAGNIWMMKKNAEMPGADFAWNRFFKEIALGTGLGLRYDFGGIFLIRLDVSFPLINPAKPMGQRWVLPKNQWKDVLLNFGIGYPF